MPSRKEVAGWLREAAEAINFYADITHYDFNGNRDKLLGIINLTKQRAAQVEAMCCETCKNFDDQFNDCLNSFDSSFTNGADIGDCGPKFGCIHHEEK